MTSRPWTVGALIFGSLLWGCLPGVAESLKVGTNVFEPFVFVDEISEKPVGYSIELWDRIETELEMNESEFVVFDSVADVLEAVESGQVDAAIAGITITAQREQTIDFSHGYYETGLRILVLDRPINPIQIFSSYLFSSTTLQAFAVVFGAALVSAHLLWIFERRLNPEMFPKGYFAGIWEAFWWSFVTATTVGYGDKCPQSVIGRAIAIVWMMAAIFVFAYFTATIASLEMRSRIEGPNDLYQHRIGAIEGTTSASYLRSRPIQLVEFTTREAAYQALKQQKIRAVVSDAPTLLYRAKRDPDFRVVGRLFAKQQYGIAFPEGSPYREPINRILLKFKEEGELEALENRWFLNEPEL
ncbi:transporter substrate-binding domain-containing protein [Oxynema sp. CENA135]|uniref:transporter substrate-binding domain-containing protein n=1 Tax=Oxynema sp. CENA135 TaxID=984206 RepID=UPI00190E43EE|nr:transporter substrate-binding domain-containing protein [Oxynema sp. CENA135]